jgi:DNA-binding transcriptional regulator YhcF (GntR family)
MEIQTIVYFCDCYLMMLDYDEELESIVQDFVKKENPNMIIKLKEECKNLLTMTNQEKNEWIEKIIEKCVNLDISIREMNDILEYIYRKI